MTKIRRLRKIWRYWLGSQSPRRSILQWSLGAKSGLLVVCIIISILSSYKLLAVPDLRPGDIALSNEIAPKNDIVIDSELLQKKRTDLVGNFIQVVDEKESAQIQQSLKNKFKELDLLTNNNYPDRISNINLSKEERKWLRDLSAKERRQWKSSIQLASKRMLSQGIIKTIALDQITNAASIQLSGLGAENSPGRVLGSKLLANVLHRRSNLRIDKIRTNQLLEELLTKQGVPQIIVKKGALITQKGKPISSQAYDVLDHFGKVRRTPRPLEWFCSFIEAMAGCGILLLIMRRESPRLQARHALLSLGLLLLVQFSKDWIGSTVSPLQLILPTTLLLSQGIGRISALAWMAIASFLWPIPVIGIGEGRLIVAAISAMLIAFQGGRMRNRTQLLQIAVFFPIATFAVQWFLLESHGSSSETNWGSLSPDTSTLISEGIILGALMMFAILLIPILENAFGLLTKARLMELADQERPLLRRLARETPGTFEHTLTICGLAEEGARSIGADVDLIRTGALYHDIGKLHAPEWFIENQGDGINPHDELNDPYKSAKILQAHVDEGLILARKNGLPGPISDFIPEHQGTMKMGYFLHQAKERNPEIEEGIFRYKGPIPSCKESAILMLADGCEAALRSLKNNATDEKACKTVKKIVNSRQLDGQLKESSLTRAEIELVARAFVRVWKRMRHKRLQYPINSSTSSS